MFSFFYISAGGIEQGLDRSSYNNLQETQRKITSFADLPDGWHYGDGVAPTPNMITAAYQWHSKLAAMGFSLTDAFPGVEGEILLSGYRDNHTFELMLETDYSVSFYHEDDGKIVFSSLRNSQQDAENAIKDATGELWSTSDFFTIDISTVKGIASQEWRSKIMEVAAPSFSMIAFAKQEYHYAPIYGNTIRQLLASRQYSGYSI